MSGTELAAFLALPSHEQATRLGRVAASALRHWPGASAPTLLQYRENAVFRVERPDGPAALRVHRQGYHDDASLRSELAWVAMLREGGLAVPAPIAAADGAPFVVAGGDGVPGAWRVDMLQWLDGRPLGGIGRPLALTGTARADTFRALGATAARLHNLSEAWTRPAWFRRHAWDDDGLVGAAPLWGRFCQAARLAPEARALLRRAGTAAGEALRALAGDGAGYGLIHADLLPENVLLGAEVQLIDFDDSGFGWHLFELATALFWYRAEPDYDKLAAALLDGYRTGRSLPNPAALPLFTLLRGLSYVGWQETRGIELTPTLADEVVALAETYMLRHG